MAFIKPGKPRKYNSLTGEGRKPPHRQGWYRLRNKNGDTVYVGKGWIDDCCRRHQKTGKLASKK